MSAKYRTSCLAASLTLGILVVGIPLLLYLFLVLPYRNFIDEEKRVLPLYAELNYKTHLEIPPPAGVQELSRFPVDIYDTKVGNIYGHGPTLSVKYEIKSTRVNSNDILSYYDKTLLANGWEPYSGIYSTYDRFYIRDTTCYVIYLSPGSDNKYETIIWHDFANQTFSPKMPPLWLIRLHEFGETVITQCPRR